MKYLDVSERIRAREKSCTGPAGPAGHTVGFYSTIWQKQRERNFYRCSCTARHCTYDQACLLDALPLESFYIKMIWEKRHFLFEPTSNETHENRHSATVPRFAGELQINARVKITSEKRGKSFLFLKMQFLSNNTDAATSIESSERGRKRNREMKWKHLPVSGSTEST